MDKLSKKTIAVDIDDVLAVAAPALIDYSNKHWGSNLRITDYSEDLPKLWQVSFAETSRRIDELFTSGVQVGYKPVPGSVEALRNLLSKYNIVVATSRPRQIRQDSIDWIEKNYKGMFSGVYFSGTWDSVTSDTFVSTKLDLCQQIGADYLIDDQPKHCLALVGTDIQPILFGDYSWSIECVTPDAVVRTKDWQAIEEYFETQ